MRQNFHIYYDMERRRYDYSNYAYVKKPKRKSALSKSLAATFIFAVILIAAVTVWLSFAGGTLTVIIEYQKCYAVCFGGFSSQEKAESYSKIIAKRGGAGYVVNDGAYFVVACAYKEKSDAESVYKNLTESGEDVCIITLETSAKNVKFDGTTEEAETFHSAVDVLKECFSLCNKLAQDLDKGQDEKDVVAQLSLMSDEITEVNGKLSGEKFSCIAKQISKLSDNINKVATELSASSLRFAAVSAFLSIGEI